VRECCVLRVPKHGTRNTQYVLASAGKMSPTADSPAHLFRLPMERVMRLGPEVSKYRRMIKVIKSSATSTRVTTAMSRVFERPVTSVEITASDGVKFVAGPRLGTVTGVAGDWADATTGGGLATTGCTGLIMGGPDLAIGGTAGGGLPESWLAVGIGFASGGGTAIAAWPELIIGGCVAGAV
jgi:hypothetical protein